MKFTGDYSAKIEHLKNELKTVSYLPDGFFCGAVVWL